MKKKWDAAHTEYFLVRNGDEYFNGASYRSESLARKDADAMNARRDTAKYGKVIVASKEREGTWSYELRL